jgi:hypothetical protein
MTDENIVCASKDTLFWYGLGKGELEILPNYLFGNLHK